MTLLKIGVVEDELVIARTILGTLEELEYSPCGPAINYTEAIEMLDHDKPDLLLLDIQLSGKKDGISVAQKINDNYHIPFIFLTANSDAETIDRAKTVKPHAYIVKPFNKEELFAAIEIAFSNFTDIPLDDEHEEVASWHANDFMFVKVGYAFHKLHFSEILYLESDANYVSVHLQSGKKLLIRSTLTDFIAQTKKNNFIRVHRSYSVNIHQIDSIFPVEISVQGFKIPIGKTYKEELFKALGIE